MFTWDLRPSLLLELWPRSTGLSACFRTPETCDASELPAGRFSGLTGKACREEKSELQRKELFCSPQFKSPRSSGETPSSPGPPHLLPRELQLAVAWIQRLLLLQHLELLLPLPSSSSFEAWHLLQSFLELSELFHLGLRGQKIKRILT